MDAGKIAEFDSPEVLFQRPGSIFRGMCESSQIALEDILKAKSDDEALLGDNI
jgi:ATP-binding cassette, subfamily C (CFTR/MRP), member 1